MGFLPSKVSACKIHTFITLSVLHYHFKRAGIVFLQEKRFKTVLKLVHKTTKPHLHQYCKLVCQSLNLSISQFLILFFSLSFFLSSSIFQTVPLLSSTTMKQSGKDKTKKKTDVLNQREIVEELDSVSEDSIERFFASDDGTNYLLLPRHNVSQQSI